MAALAPLPVDSLAVWQLATRKQVPKAHQKGFDSLVTLVCWSLWKERNSRVFEGRSEQPSVVCSKVASEISVWVLVGFVSLRSLSVVV